MEKQGIAELSDIIDYIMHWKVEKFSMTALASECHDT